MISGPPGADVAIACICVVDDDAAVRHAMCSLLEAAGYGVVAFESGEALLAAPGLADIGAAVFDVKLRGMNGFALLGRFKEAVHALGGEVPVLLVSGHSDPEMVRRAVDDGALELLRKPVDPDLLLAHVEQALRGRRGPP